jgi:cell volume regulation protein A
VTLQELYLALLLGSGVLLVAVFAVRLSARTGLPTLLLYLALGVVIGEAAIGLRFDDASLTQNFGLVALAVILAEGGLTTRWATIRPALPFALALSILGVAISVAVVAAGGYWLLGFDLRTALLLGAIVSSTDVAAVFSVLRTVPLRPRLVAALEAESGFNDAPVVILVTLIVSDAWAEVDLLSGAAAMAYQLLVGAVVGLVIGRLGQAFLSRSALPSAGLYPLATLALALGSFAAAGAIGASGFIATYLTGLWLGNAPLPHRRATLAFADGMASMAQIGLFVLLGLLASPARLPAAVPAALGIGLVLLLVARPLSVVLCALPFRIPWREQAFLSWAGLRGAVPIVLTTVAVTAGLDTGPLVFDVVFVLVVIFTLLQAPTLPAVSRALRVSESEVPHEVEVESAPLVELRAELIQVTIPEQSSLSGVSVAELRLPRGAEVTLVVRGGGSFVPERSTVLARGDRLLIVATAEARRATEQRVRAVSRAGRLAGWHGEPGEEAPQADSGGGGIPWPRLWGGNGR